MEWLEMPDGWKILEMGKDNKSCYVYIPELNSCYGALIRMHGGELYFSMFDRCIWYRIPKEVYNDG